jgi:pyruvate/2-oxoglutarate dehydrogenase complex dihydrolipoamide acyltransferase (E2) component
MSANRETLRALAAEGIFITEEELVTGTAPNQPMPYDTAPRTTPALPLPLLSTPRPALAPPAGPRTIGSTPGARNLAWELGLDLSRIVGTGEGSTILHKDVLNYAKGNTPPALSTPTNTTAPIAGAAAPSTVPRTTPALPPVHRRPMAIGDTELILH